MPFKVADLVVVFGPEEDGNEGEPDDACAVHGESDVLGLVEVLRDLPGLECVPGAEEDEDAVVGEGHHQGVGGHAAGQHGGFAARVNHLRKKKRRKSSLTGKSSENTPHQVNYRYSRNGSP